ncbi:hypothetical protein Q5P01_014948 [Channa striata]|uniref:Uncharacterized protein n=1 Tax=Channa striata TaxID=64152 RepID=A0AA88MGE8_CHASR|nr:hypothetical protein Q5P01_014948 [Channa striata]
MVPQSAAGTDHWLFTTRESSSRTLTTVYQLSAVQTCPLLIHGAAAGLAGQNIAEGQVVMNGVPSSSLSSPCPVLPGGRLGLAGGHMLLIGPRCFLHLPWQPLLQLVDQQSQHTCMSLEKTETADITDHSRELMLMLVPFEWQKIIRLLLFNLHLRELIAVIQQCGRHCITALKLLLLLVWEHLMSAAVCVTQSGFSYS